MERPINVVLVENDHLDAELAQEDFSKWKINAEVLGTEHQFRERLPIWRENPPDVFVLGSWVRWTDPAPDMPKPTQDVIDEGYHIAAGLRMRRYLSEDIRLQQVPVIIWGFDIDDRRFREENLKNLPPRTFFVNKDATEEMVLARTTRSLARALR